MFPAETPPPCVECETGPVFEPVLGRRDFIRVIGATAAAAAFGGALTPLQKARAARAAKQSEAEGLVFDLFKSMSGDQKKALVHAWDAGATAKGGMPTRLMTHNAPVGKTVIGEVYDKKQGEILHKIFKSISNGEEGYKRLSRNGKFDNSGDFENIGAIIYGEPVEGKKFSLVFSGHHITLRCDGNSEESTAFGGPLYYGHSPNGYDGQNVFAYQTKASTEVFRSFNEKQRSVAVMSGKWQDGVASVKLPAKGATSPGLSVQEMSKDQRALIETVMRELISPYRKEDGDEVMEIVKAGGGLEKMTMAFYKEGTNSEKEPWTYWRLEGPGFVWSFRALPHIHTFVNVSSKPA